MARLSKNVLIERTIQAIESDGWTVSRLSGTGEHPARFIMESEGVRHTVRLYIWNLSHGGKSRSDDEFRIQVTGLDAFVPEPGGRTLILGWSDEFGVVAGFDLHRRLRALGASPSIQITKATLINAAADGAAKQDKGNGEWAIAVRPSKLGRYVQHLAAAHAGDLEPLLADDDSIAADPLASELDYLASAAIGFDVKADAAAGDKLREAIAAANNDLIAMMQSGGDEPPPMGHNNPPGPIDDPLALPDRIEAATETIRSALESDDPDPRAIGRAGSFLAWARRLLSNAKKQAKKLGEKGADLAREHALRILWGSTVGTGTIFKEELIDLLHRLAQSILHWLQSIALF